jgi:hypothetical protein
MNYKNIYEEEIRVNSLESEQAVSIHSLEDNPVVAELLRLLAQEKAEQLTDFKELVQCVSMMETQLNHTTAELQTVKQELHSLQNSLSKENKAFFSDLTASVETVLSQGREQLHGVKNSIVHAAETTVKSIKSTGTIGLNNALGILGVRKALRALQTHLNRTQNVLEAGIERVEAVSQELRDAGGHLQNAGRVMTGKERQDPPGQVGRMTAAVLTPLRRIHDAIGKMESLSGHALNRLDSLEQAAKEERPSVKDTLKSLKSQRAQPNKLKRQEPAR